MNIFFVVILISLSINILLFLYFKWYIKRQTQGSKKDGLLSEQIEEVNRCIVDINAVTDRNILLVEDKIKELKNIMEAADKRITVFTKELEKSRQGDALYTNLGKGIRAALNTPAAAGNAVISHNAVEPPKNLPPVKQKKPPSKKQIRAHIDELVKEGLTAPQIASQLGIRIAEVELALNLINLNNQSN